jgi:hypothetical protein
MKRSILVTATVAATFWIANTPAFAQHGRPASPGAVAPSTHGSSASAESGHASSRPTSSPSSPGSVLSHNSHLTDALTDALAKKGITVNDLATTCKPFRTLGQCIAALHISHKFSSCKLADLSAAKSLGAGIQECHPQADAKAEARSATKEAKQEINDSNS